MNTEEKNIGSFLAELSSKEPVPSGGGALALSGALAASLALMVVNMTVGKKKYEAYEARLSALSEAFAEKKERFLALADADEAVFLPLAKAYGMPKETEAQKKERTLVMERCLREACDVPMRVLALAHGMSEELLELYGICSRIVVSDVGVAAKLLEAALSGAFMNVVINAKDLHDREEGRALYKEAFRLREEGTARTQETYRKVAELLSEGLSGA